MRLESRMETRFRMFSANRCDWISISYIYEIIGSFVHFGHPIFLAYFTLKTKAYNAIISDTVRLRLLFKNVVPFCLNFIAEQ